MPAEPTLEILLQHHLWANRQLMDACAPLSEEQLHTRFDIGPGSLHDTLQHMAIVLARWLDALAGKPMGTYPLTRACLAEIRTRLEELSAGLTAATTARPLNEQLTLTRGGATYTFSRATAILQVLTHAIHHRAQAMNMLRRLGITSLPRVSVIEWSWFGATPPAES